MKDTISDPPAMVAGNITDGNAISRTTQRARIAAPAKRENITKTSNSLCINQVYTRLFTRPFARKPALGHLVNDQDMPIFKNSNNCFASVMSDFDTTLGRKWCGFALHLEIPKNKAQDVARGKNEGTSPLSQDEQAVSNLPKPAALNEKRPPRNHWMGA